MTRPLRIQFPGAYYHVFSRGNERKDVFRTDDDRDLFLANLAECCDRFDVAVHSYCLMSNHIHLLIETKGPDLSDFMKRLLGVYTLRFNRIHKRTGHLFQGRYKAYLVEKDAYLLQLSRYIHLNPVKASMCEDPASYPWSSMRFFLKKDAPRYLERSYLLGQFDSPQNYRRFVLEGMKGEMVDPFKSLIAGAILGSRDFADKFKSNAAAYGISRRDELLRLPADLIMETAEGEGEDFQIYLLWRLGKMTQKRIGALFAKTDSAISHILRRFELRLTSDGALRRRSEELGAVISSFKN